MKRFWLLSAALAGSLTLAAAGFSPWDAWKNGYTLYEKGEQFRDKGDYLKALNSFEQAKKLYEQLQKNRPDWNQKIITGRIADCDREITAVKRLVGDSELTSPAASAPTGADFAEQQSLRRELEQYKQKLSEIIVENDDLRRRLARNQASQKEVANLLREQRVMQEKYALLEKRYQDLERQSLEPDQRLTELRNQLIEEKLNAELTRNSIRTPSNSTAPEARRKLPRRSGKPMRRGWSGSWPSCAVFRPTPPESAAHCRTASIRRISSSRNSRPKSAVRRTTCKTFAASFRTP